MNSEVRTPPKDRRALTPDDEYESASGGAVSFGRPDRPLYGRFHAATGSVFGAVVLCPPLGYEFVATYRAYRALAIRLVDAGFDVLRFDLDGTGNSAGFEGDSARLSAWKSSVIEAVRMLESIGHSRPHVVGVRFGAALAVLASTEAELGTLVLWDPWPSKRTVRTMHAASMLWRDESPGPTDPGSLVIAGHYISAETLADIRAIDITGLDHCAAEAVTFIVDDVSPYVESLMRHFEALAVKVSCLTIPGTTELLDVLAETAVVPGRIVEAIVDTLAARRRVTPSVRRPSLGASSRSIDSCYAEHFVRFGDVPLVGVLTTPDSPIHHGVVIFLNNGLARLVGPARTWVEWSRALAANGVSTLRLDTSGLGDSATRPGQRRDAGYAIEAIDDLQIVTTELRVSGHGPSMLAGVCSGALLSIDAVQWLDAIVGVVSINPSLHHTPDEPGAPSRRRRAAPPTQRWLQRSFTTRAGYKLTPMIPSFVWATLSAVRLHPVPSKGVERAAQIKPIVLAYWIDDEGLQRLRRQDKAGYKRLRSHASIEFHELDPGDHSLFSRSMRDTTFKILLDTAKRLLPDVVRNEGHDERSRPDPTR